MGPDIWSVTAQRALGKAMAACCGNRKETHQSQQGSQDGPRRMAVDTKLLPDSPKKYAPQIWVIMIINIINKLA